MKLIESCAWSIAFVATELAVAQQQVAGRPTTFPTTTTTLTRATLVSDAYLASTKLASQKRPDEALALLELARTKLTQEIAAFEKSQSSHLTAAATPAARELRRMKIDLAAIALGEHDQRLRAAALDGTGWASAYAKSLSGDAANSGDVLGRAIELFGSNQFTKERLFDLLRVDLPSEATSVVAMTLLSLHAPDKAQIQEIRRFYEELIARSALTPVAADSFLSAYAAVMDRRGQSEALDGYLVRLVITAPDSALACRAASLHLGVLGEADRSKLVAQWAKAFLGTRLSAMLSQEYAQLLFGQHRYLEGAHALDVTGSLFASKDHAEFSQRLVTLVTRASAVENGEVASSTADKGGSGATQDVELRRNVVVFDRTTRRAATTRPAAFSSPPSREQILAGCLNAVAELPLATVSDGNSDSASGKGSVPNMIAFVTNSLKAVPLPTLKSRFGLAEVKTPVAVEGIMQLEEGRLLLTASSTGTAGNPSEAIAAYRAILGQSSLSSNVRARAHALMIELLLKTAGVDSASIAKEIDQLMGGTGDYSPIDPRELKLRLLFRQVAALEDNARPAAWSEGIKRLDRWPINVSDAGWNDIAGLKSLNSKSLPFSRALADLIALVPDTDSMRLLQEWRVKDLNVRGSKAEASAAWPLLLALSAVSDGGPQRAITAAGAGGDFPNGVAAVLSAGSGGNPTTPSRGDTELSEAAARAASGTTAPAAGRRQAYLNLFTSKNDDALRIAGAALNASSPVTGDSFAALMDIAVIIAAVDGTPVRSQRFAASLTDAPNSSGGNSADAVLKILRQALESKDTALPPPTGQTTVRFSDLPAPSKAAIGKQVLFSWGRMIAAAAVKDLKSGKPGDAAAAFAWAINSQTDLNDAAAVISDGIQLACAGRGAAEMDQVLRPLDEMESRIDLVPAREALKSQVLSKRRDAKTVVANELYEKGDYDGCLLALNQRDQLLPPAAGAEDMGGAYLKAMSLIRLNRTSDALPVLAQMKVWKGSDEEHARALFLTGFIHLQSEERAGAKQALGELLEKYPNTSFAPKAKELAQSLE